MPTITACSACRRELQVPDEFVGKLVKCPLCDNTFTALSVVATPDPPPPAPPPLPESFSESPQRRRAYETGPSSRHLRDDDDYHEGDRGPPRRRRRDMDDDWEADDRPRRRPPGLSELSNDYAIDIATWFDHAKERYANVLGPMIGYILLNILLNILFGSPEALPGLGPIFALAMTCFVNPALQAGYAIVALAELRGRYWSFGDFFSGFRWYGALLGSFWLMVAIGILCMTPSLLVLVVTGVLAAATRRTEVMSLAIFVAIFNLLPAIYVLVRTSCFSVQLIVDRNCGPWQAVQGSWQLSRGHFWGLFGVSLLLVLIMAAGLLACFIGVLFAVPLAVLTWNAGYLIVTGNAPRRRRRDDDDPYDERERYDDDR